MKIKKNKKPACLSFSLGAFVARVTTERVDIENVAKTWKTVFMAGTDEYILLASLLVPEAFPDSPDCVEIAKDEQLKANSRENVEQIANVLYTAAMTVCADPQSPVDLYNVFTKSLKRRMAEAEKQAKLTPEEDAAILAEERAFADPTPENVVAAEEAREAAEKAKKPKKSPKKSK